MDFENIMGRVSDFAQAGAAKARELAEITKLKVANVSEEDAIRRAYIEIGKLYYSKHGLSPESPYAAFCEKITASREKIAYNKQKIADIKAASNMTDEEVSEEETAEEEVIVEEPSAPEETAE